MGSDDRNVSKRFEGNPTNQEFRVVCRFQLCDCPQSILCRAKSAFLEFSKRRWNNPEANYLFI